MVCEQILNDIYASAEFRAQAGERCLILHGDWQSGMIGIVASKLVDRFCRPCFIFTRAEGLLKGSGRSIEGVNLFELLSSMSELFVRFGGHAQAAGLTLEEGNYEAFKAKVKEALAPYPREVFRRAQGGDLPIAAADITLALCKELELLEPCGVGNRAPVFLLTDNLDLRPMKKHRAHFSCTVGEAGFTAFGMHKYRHVISCPCQKDYLVELSVNEFREKFSPRANVRSLSVPFSRAAGGTEDGVLWLLASAAGSETPQPIAEEEIAEKLAKDYGVLVLSFDRGHLGEFAERHKLTCEIACYADNRNNDSKMLFDPPADLDCSGYAEVIYLEAPIRGLPGSRALAGSSFKLPVSLDRKVFGEYFRAMNRLLAGGVQMEDVRDLYDEIGLRAGLEEQQFYVCLFTFLELGFFKLEEGRVVAVPGARADLSQSKFYRRMSDHLA